MKKTIYYAAMLLVFGLFACEKEPNNNQNGNNNNNENNNSGGNSSIKLTYELKGTISPTDWEADKKASVEFSRIPSNVNEFKEVQKVLGKEPHGAIALEVMAFEMFRRNASVGTQCLELNSTPTNVNPVTSRLKELFRKDDSYARPYQAAAFLKGASASNGYNPTKPYTIEVRVSPATEYQYSNDYEANVLFIEINSNGHEENWRVVYVVKPPWSDYYLIDNNPGMYAQCKKISYGQEWKGLD